MSVNRQIPYLIVIFEDNAYKDLFQGFKCHLMVNSHQIREDIVVGGWMKAKDKICDTQSMTYKELLKYPKAFVLLLIDNDDDAQRPNSITEQLNDAIKNRVFVISSAKEAEDIVSFFGGGKKDKIGRLLAENCYAEGCSKWQSDLLRHNLSVIGSIRQNLPNLLN